MPSQKNPLVTDIVHGEIHLTPLERDIIRTGTFARTANIKALGLAYYVWPGATHTRFSHSVGCMHIVGKIARHLQLDGELDDRDVDDLRLAGLLHDVGQYPLSHVVEAVYRQIAGAKSEVYLEDPSVLASIGQQPLLWRAAVRPPGIDAARDKALAQTVIMNRRDIQRVFKKHGFTQDRVDRVVAIIAGKHLDTLFGHLLDSEYDCDRFDYVLRDSKSAGVSYGLIELDYLIENMTVSHPDDGKSPDRVLAVNGRRALHALEHFLMARYFMYSQVIYHKTVRSLELLARAAYLGLVEEGLVYPDFERIQEIVSKNEFILFNDFYFLEKLHKYCRRRQQKPELKRIVERVLFRRPLHFMREFKCLAKSGQEPPEYAIPRNWLKSPDNLATLADDSGLSPGQIVVEELPVEMVPFGSEIPVDVAMRDDKEMRRAVTRSPRLFDDETQKTIYLFQDRGSLLADLAGKHLRLLRVYVNSDDPATHGQLRKAIRTRTGY